MYNHNKKIVVVLIAALALEVSLVIFVQVLTIGVDSRTYLSHLSRVEEASNQRSCHDSRSSTSARSTALRAGFISEVDVHHMDSHHHV